MYKITLQYFKKSGKYYSEGHYFTEKSYMGDVFDEIYQKLKDENLPGLRRGAVEFIIYVDADEHPNGFPALLNLSLLASTEDSDG